MEKTEIKHVEGSLDDGASSPRAQASSFIYKPPVDDFFLSHRPVALVEERAAQLAHDCGLEGDMEIIRRGALLANDPQAGFASASPVEQRLLMDEVEHRFRLPWAVWWVAVVNAMVAIVQGMDETVTSGAQLYFLKEFGLDGNAVFTGFLNASPYLTCATLGCWLSVTFNSWIGRRGTIFVFCIVAAVAAIWEAVSPNWQIFLGARLVLGISIGAKSATVAMYTAECTPTAVRGGLVMFWQVFVAFGIMLGFLMGVAFVNVHEYLNWRLMMGSSFVAPVLVLFLVYFGPESPRWYIIKNRHAKAWSSMKRLRFSELQAARDLFYISEAFQAEQEMRTGRSIWSDIRDMFCVPRVRYGALSAWIIMFMQNFCGINAITYYTGQIFVDTGVSAQTAVYASFGAGALNFIFALPAIKYIDTYGRRKLLMWSLLSMAVFLLWTGFSFYATGSKLRLALVAVGMYMYEVSYSPGQGPVPFVYASEAFPLYLRPLGMSFATATTWFFGFILTLAWPSQLAAMGPTGAFGFYAAFSVVGTVVVFFIVPETCGRSLEELDVVFSLPIRAHAGYQWRNMLRVLGIRKGPREDLAEIARRHFMNTAEAAAVVAHEKQEKLP
ncbi:MAG: ATP synthase F0 subcomplex subunit OSCP atp5 [Chaenotheca gracillima]|nr:MAG: ATP synthase F0 subcomplex subunit OSCP atp5 [Chaenotheca gracillima]